MAKRNLIVPFNFACITEDPQRIDPSIKIIPIPKYSKIQGWWYKPWVFSREFPLKGTILFLDLDLVIIKNIDNLWTHEPRKFCIIRDFARSAHKEWNKFNSSVFRFESGQYNFVWDNLVKDLSQTKKMHGDQDWIYNQIKSNYAFWPDEWIQSYKWEIRTRTELMVANSKHVFKKIIDPVIQNSTSILVFHGNPKPDMVKDPVIVKNWR